MATVVVTEPQEAIRAWLCQQIRYVPSPNMTCLGLWDTTKQELRWVVGYDHWTAASAEIHVAGSGFCSREFLYKVFSYPFEHAGVSVLIGKVSSGNTPALDLDLHLGFKEMCRIPNATIDGDLVIMAMQRADCRWLRLGKRKLKEVA